MRLRHIAALLAVLLLLATFSACGVGDVDAVVPPADQEIVDLEIVKGDGDSTLALAPVTINGKGPFSFALDTGAASSVIDRDLAKRLKLDVVRDSHHTVRGVTGRATTQLVRLDDWQLDDIVLQPSELSAIDVPGPLGQSGLLGSDVLQTFGTVTLDYDAATLQVGTPDDGG